MQTNYDKLTLTHSLSRVILHMDRYKYIYGKVPYAIRPVFALYYNSIEKDMTRTEVNQAEGENKAKWNDRSLYVAAKTQ